MSGCVGSRGRWNERTRISVGAAGGWNVAVREPSRRAAVLPSLRTNRLANLITIEIRRRSMSFVGWSSNFVDERLVWLVLARTINQIGRVE